MMNHQKIAIFLSLALAASTAYAEEKGKDEKSKTESLRWTQDDVATFCHSRFGADDQSFGYKSCVSRDAAKIGKSKTVADLQELEADKAGLQQQ